MKNILKIFNTRSSSSGFTLIELLVAASLTTLVVSLTGFGVVAMMENNKNAKAETDRRVELNRALDFIADEVRQAQPIATSASANLSTVASNFSSSGKTPVLTLQIPGVDQRVIYYIAPKATGSPWLGPNVVYRWGPNFATNGTYSNPTTPANWTDEPLADLIVDNAPSSTPSCLINWSLNPPSSITGFYACVDPSGRIAEIHLRGKLTGAYGNSKPPFEVLTKAFARPYSPPFTINSGSSNSGGNGGTVTITQPSTMYIEVLGGSIACSPTAPLISTTTTINVTPNGGSTSSTTVPSTTKALNFSVPVGTTLTVSGKVPTPGTGNNTCGLTGNYNSATNNGTQVLTLRNGDSPPLFNPYGSQPSIDAFLTKYLNPTTGKVTLAENQVIYLFELGTTNTSSAAYDMQDLVVLATIAPIH